MTAPEFWSMAEAHICLQGNFYAYKLGIEGRPVRELLPLKPGAVTKIEQEEDFSLTYHVRLKDGTIKPMPSNKFLHLRGLTLDGITGVNPIEYARETIGLGTASVQFLARYFGKGMHPSAILKHPGVLNAPTHSKMKKNFKEKYASLGKSHEFMIIDEAMDITFPQIKLVDAQYLEQMKLTDAQICGLFRVPLMLINGGDKEPTYASAEQFMLFYQMFSIDAPLYEAAIWRDLMNLAEQKKYYAKFELKALQRGSFKEQIEGFAIGIDKEIYNPNEVRALLDMNPRTDPGGEEYRTRTSTVKDTAKQKEENKEE
jgi:HK97 family phage portal protein